MFIIKQKSLRIAIINPKLKETEDGQYLSFRFSDPGAEQKIEEAKNRGFEIRYYYENMVNNQGENIPLKVVITEIPPNHQQTYHRHSKNYEMYIANNGKLIVKESYATNEEDIRDQAVEVILDKGDAVIQDPAIFHTIKNADEKNYVQFTTILTSRINSRKIENDRR